MHLWGWMSPTELEWLRDRAAYMRSVVEVGSLHGRSSYALATGCAGQVYCIDPWPDGAWPSWRDAMAKFDHVVALRGLSPAMGEWVADPVDMVFLDGAHDRASVEADIDYWEPRTQRLLSGHDYGHGDYPDVKAVVDEWFGDRVESLAGTGIWWVTAK
jgi:hypothetical protein